MGRSRELLRGALLFLVLITLVISFVGLGLQEEGSQSNEEFVIVYNCGEIEPGTGLFFPKVCGFYSEIGHSATVVAELESFSSVANDGNAAFFCMSNLPGSGDLRSVCSQHLRSGDPRVHLIEEIDVRTITSLQINNAGIILAICQTYLAEPPQFCTIDTTTGEFDIVTGFDGSEEFQLDASRSETLTVNNQGQAIHYCSSLVPTTFESNLCTFNLNRFEAKQLELDFRPVNPVLTESGIILAGCENLSGEHGFTALCSFNFDGTEVRFVTSEFAGLEVTNLFDMNELGQIAFACNDLDRRSFQLCVINLDGTGFAKLTATESRVSNIHITEAGQIIYQCTVEDEPAFCSMNFDGSNFQVLTSDSGSIYDVIPAI